MTSAILSRHAGLSATTRMRRLVADAMTPTMLDWALLVAFGVLAALSSTFVDLGIQRVPGHAILRVIFPFALGLAIVPRHGAGCVMGGVAAVAGALLRAWGFQGEGLGIGAFTSLVATGPLLDWTLRRVNGGWRQLVAFGLAGLASNLLALGVRGVSKWVGWESPGRRPLADWLSQAVGTYILCGILAGAISGLILFSFRRRNPPSAQEPPT
jgi:hypothetical protein